MGVRLSTTTTTATTATTTAAAKTNITTHETISVGARLPSQSKTGSDRIADSTPNGAPAGSSDRTSADESNPLSTSMIWIFSAPAAGQGFMYLFLSVYLLAYATEVLGLAPAAMGLIFLASRLWDAVSDPLAGYLSDHTKSRIGRRRPWLLAGALPVGAVFVVLVAPPEFLDPDQLFWWMLVATLLFHTGMTIFGMPHDSLGAELSTDYHERNRIFGIRRFCFGIGSLAMFGALSFLTDSENPRATALTMAIIVGIFTSISMLGTGIFVREPKSHQGRGAANPWTAMRDVLANPHARLLLIVFFSQQLGIAAVSTLMPFITRYQLGDAGLLIPIMGTVFGVSILAIPLWIRLGHHFEKKSLVSISMAMVGSVFGLLAFVQPGQVAFAIGLGALAGLAIGGLDVLTPSIQADVIDYDELATGERKEGVYFAAWHFVAKTGMGISGAVVGFLLSASGFVAGQAQSDDTLLAMRFMAAGIPVVCYATGLVVFLRFRMTRKEHAEIQAQLVERRSRGT
jgi:GPH family glycoside/pentoside/hexuronide:cation symporter